MNLGALLPFLAPMLKQVWEGLIHPELLALEGTQIKSEDLKIVAAAIDAALDKIIEAEIPRIPAAPLVK